MTRINFEAEIEALREHFEGRDLDGVDACAVMGAALSSMFQAEFVAEDFCKRLRASVADNLSSKRRLQ